jgi:hypothetical protein
MILRTMRAPTYEELLAQVIKLRAQGRLPLQLTREEIIDWAYGNTKIENDDITREMVAIAVDAKRDHHV